MMPITIKMTHLSTLLLLFLLVNASLSLEVPRLPKSSGGWLARTKGGSSLPKLLRKAFNNLIKQNESPPPPPNAAPEKIQGLSVVKEYLYLFGYINYSDPFTDYLDAETVRAIKTYQVFFNLKVTGQLDNETLNQISIPRCGVPDLNFTYDLTTSNLSWPKGKQWFPKATKALTYGFLPASHIPLNATNVFRLAFQRWSRAIGVLNLTEATSFDAADITVGFYDFIDSTFQDLLFGDAVIELDKNGSHVNIFGDLRLDATKYWVLPGYNGNWSYQDGGFDLETVAMHHIGHLLGLSHSSVEESVMYPSVLPSQQRKVQLSNDDQKNIQQLYNTNGTGNGSVSLP